MSVIDKQIEKLDDFPVVVIWKKSEGAKKHYMTVFNKISIDRINTTRARKPLIPLEYPFMDIGVGKRFIKDWIETYGIKSVEWVNVNK